MARIYRKNNSWYFTIEAGMQANGKRRRIIRGGFSREKDAKEVARDFEHGLDTGMLVIKTNNITTIIDTDRNPHEVVTWIPEKSLNNVDKGGVGYDSDKGIVR